jgi:hypothetical protein
MLGCTGSFSHQDADPNVSEQDLYIHGYVSGRMFKSGKNAEGEGLPITVAASYVLSPPSFPYLTGHEKGSEESGTNDKRTVSSTA